MNPLAAVSAMMLAAVLTAFAQQLPPDPAAILKGARMAAALVRQDNGLEGNLTKGAKKIPLALFLKGKDIQFQFSEVKDLWKVFHLRLDDEELNLFEMIDGRMVQFPAAKLVEPIAGTDVTYEDLSMRFLYWPNPQLEGEESVNGFDCYKLRVDKPKQVNGRYAAVYVWVSKKHGAFIRVQGYDKGGGLVKEFQVLDVMPLDGGVWGLKKMQVSTHDPANGRRTSITNLVFDGPRQLLRPGGLR